MDDKILQVKKSVKEIINSKNLTRIEKERLVRERSSALNSEELEILLREYHRNLASFDRLSDAKEIISVLLTGVGFWVTILGFYFNQKQDENVLIAGIMCFVSIYVVLAILLISGIQTYRSRNMDRIQHTLDILEKGCHLPDN